jgi:hypothetical protein
LRGTSSFIHCANGDRHLRDHRVHFRRRFPSRLAGLARDDLGQLRLALAQAIGEALGDRGAIG